MRLDRLRAWARDLKRDAVALQLAAVDARTPLHAKLVAGATAAYALSPIDLIPDFVPVLGLLDDLIIVPLGLWLAIRLIPPPLMAEFRAEAGRRTGSKSLAGLMLVIGVWIAIAAIAGALIARRLHWPLPGGGQK